MQTVLQNRSIQVPGKARAGIEGKSSPRNSDHLKEEEFLPAGRPALAECLLEDRFDAADAHISKQDAPRPEFEYIEEREAGANLHLALRQL